MWMKALSMAGLLLTFRPAPAQAVDGVVEINQARASAGGVTAGDTPGFPVTISRSGSYRLTSDLSSGVQATTLISITANFVTLDLGGFTVSHCASGLCAPGSGLGISAALEFHDVTVRNGNVYNSGGRCISLDGARARVEDVRVLSCGETGVLVGDRSVIDGVISEGSVASGLVLRERGHVLRSTVFDNGSFGVIADLGSLIESTVISQNAGGGMTMFSGSSAEPVGYHGCVIQANGGVEAQIPASSQVFFRSLGNNACGTDTTCP